MYKVKNTFEPKLNLFWILIIILSVIVFISYLLIIVFPLIEIPHSIYKYGIGLIIVLLILKFFIFVYNKIKKFILCFSYIFS
jgi:hypothetical protein